MIDTKTEELAALYVLDLLQGQELEAFERQMEKDEQLVVLVRELSSGLHAPMKNFNGPERMDLLQGIQEKIGSAEKELVIEPSSPSVETKQKIFQIGWIQALGAAAALLLTLNLYQFFNPQAAELEQQLQDSLLSQQALLEENETIKAFNKSWETEYMGLAERMLSFIGSVDGHGEFTVVDLVAVGNDPHPAGSGTSEDVGDYILSRSPLKFASISQVDQNHRSNFAPMGYAVWKSDESMGYLDLYNMKGAGRDRVPFLWVRENPTEQYVAVGQLPALENGTGTFYFQVEQEGFRPTEFLITEEPLDGPGDQPSPHQMMVGP